MQVARMDEWIFDRTSDPALVVRADGTIVRANRAVESVLGYVRGSLEERSLGEIVGPEERTGVLAFVARCAGVDEPGRLLTRICTSFGSSRHVELHGAQQGDAAIVFMCPVLEGGDELGHLRTIARRWDALIDCLPDHVFALAPDGTILYVDHAAPGFTLDGVVGRSIYALIDPDEVDLLRRQLERAYAGETVVQELTAIFPDGNLGTFRSRLGPVRDGSRVIGVIGVAQDISEQRRDAEAQAQAQKTIQEYTVQLERSNRELERFASIASHDLQEPLRKILAYSDRLQHKHGSSLSEAGSGCLARVQEAARRMQNLIDDILIYSRLTARGEPLVPVKLGRVVAAVLSDLEVRIDESAAKVEVGLLPTIYADPVHMHQLFQNLIGNALKFRRVGVAPEIKVAASLLRFEGSADPVVRITVTDNGIGIDPKYSRRIFGIFERLHGRGKYEGTGIGLAVCRKICEQLGGTITVDSAEDQGSTFIVELPTQQRERQS